MRLILLQASTAVLILIVTSMPLQACGLAFLPGSAVTIDGSLTTTADEWSDAATVVATTDPCLDQIQDGTSIPSLEPSEVRIYTKRSATDFYIGIDVDDGTLPETSAGTSPNERIIIYLDPNNSRGSAPQSNDYRFEVLIPRDETNLAAHRIWANGVGGVFGSTTIPPGVTAMSRNHGSGTLGYYVEIKIPFSAVGYSLSSGDFGIALAVINDLGFQKVIGGFAQWQLSAVGLPADSVHLPTNIDDDPIDYADSGSNWNTPDHWGEGFTTGAGELVYFSHDPKFWKSKDIISAFCNAPDFDTVNDALGVGSNPRSTANPYWYKYDADNTCNPVRVWSKIRRKGALVGIEQRRVLFLWGEPGISVREWFYMGITGPISLDPNSSPTATDETFPAIFAITDSFDWGHISPGLSGHPCLRAIALPEQLQASDLADFASYDADPTSRHQVDLSDLLSRYGITGQNNQAQMNILVVDGVTCPECVAPDDRASLNGFMLASTDLNGLQLDQATTKGGKAMVEVSGGQKHSPKFPDAIFDLVGYGIARGKGDKKYSYVEQLGGLQQVINLNYLRERGEITIPINFTNPKDLSRHIFINVKQLTSEKITNAELAVKTPKNELKPGEKIVLETTVKAKLPVVDECDGTSLCGKCIGKFDISALATGIAMVGFTGLRRKRNTRKKIGANQR